MSHPTPSSPTPAHHREHPGTVLRRLMDHQCVGLPGAFNGLVARAVAQAGFSGCYVSGAAVSASFGVPDVGMLTLNEFTSVVRQVAMGGGLPVIADADTGFGESEMAVRTVHEYNRAGAAGLHLEDQVFPKRCGHLDGKSLVKADHMVEKIAAASRAAIACSDGAFIVCARTDARGVESFESAVDRARAYVEAGASMIFPEGLASAEEFARFASQVRRGGQRTPYLLANMTEFGKTPIIPLSEFHAMGYSCVIWPVTTLRAAMGEVTRILNDLKRDGHVESFLGRVQSRKDLYGLLGYTPGTEWAWPS